MTTVRTSSIRKTHIVAMIVVAIGAVIVVMLSVSCTPDAQDVTWNDEAESVLFEKNMLATMGNQAMPGWKRMQLIWPSQNDIALHNVRGSSEMLADLTGWLQRLMKADAVPENAAEHAIAMKKWGLYRPEIEQGPLDVFIMRFERADHTVQILDFNHIMVIAIADENRADKAATDLKEFVLNVAKQTLNIKLLPDPQKNMHGGEPRKDGRMVHFVWAPPSIVSYVDNGRKRIDLDAADKQIGTYHVEAETDGRFVRFVIRKYRGGSGDPAPDVNRFDPAATERSRK